jgi:MFS family permease
MPLFANTIGQIRDRLRGIYYGWVIVLACTLMMAVAYGIMYSYSVFFKPLVDHFNWDRATVASIYSISLLLRGAVSIGVGWLADRYGARKLTVFCGLMTLVGLVSAGRVGTLWQFYLTYGLILSIGLSGAFTITSAVTSQWFRKKRGAALGIVSTGSGMGTLFIVPLSGHLLARFDWSEVFTMLGIAAGILVTASAFLLKPAPAPAEPPLEDNKTAHPSAKIAINFKNAVLSREMTLLLITFSFVAFCVQMIMVHLANHTIDVGITPFQAATFIGVIGIVSIAGRLCMGSASDKIGTANSLIICGILRVVALVWLMFCSSPMDFYIFAVIFGFAYGGEIPQYPLFIGEFFGTRAMAALMGVMIFVSNIGGALGPLGAGKIHDLTHSYTYAFIAAIVSAVLVLIMALWIKRLQPAKSLD